jgi:hypothetical protein
MHVTPGQALEMSAASLSARRELNAVQLQSRARALKLSTILLLSLATDQPKNLHRNAGPPSFLEKYAMGSLLLPCFCNLMTGVDACIRLLEAALLLAVRLRPASPPDVLNTSPQGGAWASSFLCCASLIEGLPAERKADSGGISDAIAFRILLEQALPELDYLVSTCLKSSADDADVGAGVPDAAPAAAAPAVMSAPTAASATVSGADAFDDAFDDQSRGGTTASTSSTSTSSSSTSTVASSIAVETALQLMAASALLLGHCAQPAISSDHAYSILSQGLHCVDLYDRPQAGPQFYLGYQQSPQLEDHSRPDADATSPTGHSSASIMADGSTSDPAPILDDLAGTLNAVLPLSLSLATDSHVWQQAKEQCPLTLIEALLSVSKVSTKIRNFVYQHCPPLLVLIPYRATSISRVDGCNRIPVIV